MRRTCNREIVIQPFLYLFCRREFEPPRGNRLALLSVHSLTAALLGVLHLWVKFPPPSTLRHAPTLRRKKKAVALPLFQLHFYFAKFIYRVIQHWYFEDFSRYNRLCKTRASKHGCTYAKKLQDSSFGHTRTLEI